MRAPRPAVICLTLGLLAAPAAARQAEERVAHWNFDEITGTVLADSAGNGLDATINAGVSLGGSGGFPSTGACAKFNSAMQGYGTVVEQPALAALSDNLSVAAWVHYVPGTGLISRIFGGDNSAWSCGITNTGLRFTTRGIKDYDLPLAVPSGTWIHLAYVFDANRDVTFYLDGNPVGTVAGSQPANASSGVWLVGAFSANLEYWHGYLDDVQVYRGALTAGEVTFLFQNPGAWLTPQAAQPFCHGDPQAGVCPCGNLGGTGEGCANSTGAGGRVAAAGTASLALDDLVLAAGQLPPNRPAILFAGHQTLGGGAGLLFGDGLRCAGGAVRRLGTRMADGAGAASWGPALGLQLGAQPADRWHFQVWYQDPVGSPCGLGFNTTHALQVDFTP